MSLHAFRLSPSTYLTALLLPFALLAAVLVPAVLAPAAAAAPAADGSSPVNAAASCWEAKQVNPEAASGLFWLLTPAMAAPEQFYCDQQTSGGGWVLIGRGREGWRENYEGRGTSAQVREPVTGPVAFAPRQLSAAVIDDLLNGQAPDTLADGVRLRRATNTDGTQWQEASFKLVNMDRWVWTISAEHKLVSYRFGTTTTNGGDLRSFGRDQNLLRVATAEAQAQGWTQGWAFGSNARGSTAADSYVWSASSSIGNPRPFTQVFLRPQLTQSDVSFGAIPDEGTAAYAQRPLPQSGALGTVWGVAGLANGRSGELNTEVQDFAQVGDTVFVAGNFRWVQRNSGGADRVEQSYLAGFNVHTGEWVSGFRPVFNGQAKAVEALPDGRLAVGGEFSTLNGAPAAGLAVLDPASGAASPGWSAALENRLTGGIVQVRGLSVHDGWLYLGGAFTHLSGGGSSSVYSRSAARVAVADGTPDGSWNPAFNGTVVAVDASDDGGRFYAAGYFSASNSTDTLRAAAVQTVPGAPLADPAWTWTPSHSTNYQQAIQEVGSRVWLGGAQHSLFSFSTADFSRLSSNIAKQGGDFQRISAGGGTVYAACHCGHWNYSGATTWSDIGTGWSSADRINLFGAWDAGTGDFLPEFNPVAKGRAGHGVWAILVDSLGNVWSGGDYETSVTATGASQWSGGFMRFAPRDAAVPGAPSGLTAVTDGTADSLSWSPAGGDAAVYHVLREDRVIAATTQTSISVPALAGGRYFVRAADASGNYSASTAAVVPAPAAPPPPPPAEPVQLIAAGSDWKFRYRLEAPPADWTALAFDDATWTSGPAPLGYGISGIATPLTIEGTKPLSSHYRRTFQVADPAAVREVTITTRADDGVVVYLNGTEVGRVNMPAGSITNNTYATAAVSPSAALANPVMFTLPGSALAAGTNVITAEVHSNYRSTPSHSFELTASAALS